MKPYIYRGVNHTNFGDELNLLLWDRLGLAPYFSDGPGLLFGIGTLLKDPMPAERPLIVFGSGVGYGPAPSPDGLEIMFVRGPHTSMLMGDAPWITDPGILVAHLTKRQPTGSKQVFIPHWTSIEADSTLVARMADIGIEVIDPRWSVTYVINEIARASVVLTEALHGAIVADALRVPWVPVYAQHGHLFKWLDWSASMNLVYEPEFVEVRSMKEIAGAEIMMSAIDVHTERLEEMDRQVDLLKARLAR